MKITDIKVYLPLGLLRIQTDAGIEGLSGGCGDTCAEFIQQVYRPELLGQDPYHRQVIWQRLMHLERLRYPPANVYRAVVDNALWDLAGKAAGMPVWKRLGGYRDHIPCYRSAPDLEIVDEYLEDARRVQALGFNWGIAHANLYGAIKNTTLHENNADLDRDPIVRNPLQVRDGILYTPAGPGLGFDLDPEIVAQRTERVA